MEAVCVFSDGAGSPCSSGAAVPSSDRDTMDVEFREARLAQKNYEENLFQMKHMAMQNGGGVGTKNGKISIRLPEGVDGSSVQVTNDYVKQTIKVVMPQTDEAYFDSAPVSGSSSYIDIHLLLQTGRGGNDRNCHRPGV